MPSARRPATRTGCSCFTTGAGPTSSDLLRLADVLDPERRLLVVTPRAPLRVAGSPGFHWYLVPRVGYPDPETFAAARHALAELHDELWEATGLTPERTVLGGFSMGCVMSYALGLDAARPAPAAILAFSGFIPTVPGWEPDIEARRGLPVLVAHGRQRPCDRGRVRTCGGRAAAGGRARGRLPRVRRRAPDRPLATSRSASGRAGGDASAVQRIRLRARQRSLVSVTANGSRTEVGAQPARADRRRGLRRHRAAIELRRHGIEDVTILEKAPRSRRHLVLQHLPGRGVRRARATSTRSPTPSAATGRGCARPQQEIHDYLHEVARALRRRSARAHRRRRSPPAAGTRPPRRWTVETAEGERYEADALVLATGQLHQPHVPLIAGRERLRRAQLPLRRLGPRLPARAASASASSAPAPAPSSSCPRSLARSPALTVFQRTGNWFLPRKNRPYPALRADGLRTRSRACRRCAGASSSSTASR